MVHVKEKRERCIRNQRTVKPQMRIHMLVTPSSHFSVTKDCSKTLSGSHTTGIRSHAYRGGKMGCGMPQQATTRGGRKPGCHVWQLFEVHVFLSFYRQFFLFYLGKLRKLKLGSPVIGMRRKPMWFSQRKYI